MKNKFYNIGKLPKEFTFEPGTKITMSTLYGKMPKKKIDFKDIIGTILGIIFSIILVLVIIHLGILIAEKFTKKYIYVDMNGSTGKSYECYYNESSRDLRCMIPVKVQQYTEEK